MYLMEREREKFYARKVECQNLIILKGPHFARGEVMA